MARPRSTGQSTPAEQPTRLRGAAAYRLHLTLVLGLVLCIGAFSLEVNRAWGGNRLSWAYVFEWPIFAAFAVYMWWNRLHDHDRRAPRSGRTDTPGSVDDSQVNDPDLEAWKRYLRTMEAAEAADTEHTDNP